MKRLFILLCIVLSSVYVGAQTTVQWPPTISTDQGVWLNAAHNFSNASWTVPPTVTSVFIECWGAGGGGGAAQGTASTWAAGGGGGGGAYSNVTLPVSPGQTLYITNGLRGRAGQGSATPSQDGGDAFVAHNTVGNIVVRAQGGRRGTDRLGSNTGAGAGGAGGLATNGIGDLRRNGGNGGTGSLGSTRYGGGGGGGSGSSGVGGNGGAPARGVGSADGGNGGLGATHSGSGSGAACSRPLGFGGGGAGPVCLNYVRGGSQGYPGVVRITYISTLGVQLSSFRATCDKNINILWTTSSEKNSEYFALERSRNGQEWQLVTTFAGAETTNDENTYSYSDNAYEEVYYRLKQVDFDGKTEYYGPIAVNCNSNANSLVIFPNPSNGEFAVEINSSEMLEGAAVSVYDLSGKQLLRQDLNGKLKGTNTIYFTDNNLAPGTYLVVVESETKNSFIPVKLVIR